MTSEEFVDAVRARVLNAAVKSTLADLQTPIGRQPDAACIARSAWYDSLSESDRSLVADLLREAAKSAMFHFFCVIDGVAVIEPAGPKSDFRLIQQAPDGSENCLNPPDGEFLHDIFNAV
jgi:hypothetical protein